MPIISVICPWCQTRLKAADSMIGHEAQCPECSKMVPITGDAGTAASTHTYDLKPQLPPPAPPPTTLPGDAPPRIAPLILEREAPPGPRVYLRLGEVQFTTKRLGAMALMLAVTFAVLAGWWFTRTTASALVIAAQPVQAYTALATILRLAPPDDGKVVYTVGGEDRLMLTRPGDDADFLLIRLDVPREVLLRHAKLGRAGTTLRSELFVLEGGHLPAKGWILATEFSPGLTLDLSAAPTRSGRTLLPAEARSAQEQPTTADGAILTYDGYDGATGIVRFRPLAQFSQANGLYASGALELDTPGGSILKFDYFGTDMNVTWDQATTGWHGATQHTLDRPSRLPQRVPITLLLARPQRTKTPQMTLLLGGEPIATIWAHVAAEPSAQRKPPP